MIDFKGHRFEQDIILTGEPPRVLRRLHHLREWSLLKTRGGSVVAVGRYGAEVG